MTCDLWLVRGYHSSSPKRTHTSSKMRLPVCNLSPHGGSSLNLSSEFSRLSYLANQASHALLVLLCSTPHHNDSVQWNHLSTACCCGSAWFKLLMQWFSSCFQIYWLWGPINSTKIWKSILLNVQVSHDN